MNPEVIVPLGVFAMVTIIVIGIPIVRAWAKNLERKGSMPPQLPNADVVARLERIEQAIEVMATQVERITEGQRFVTKLLSEPRPAAHVGAVAGVVAGVIAPAANPAAIPATTQVAPQATPTPNTPPSNPADGTVFVDTVKKS